MQPLKTKTIPEQVAEHLRREIVIQRWTGEIPGRDILSKQLNVSTRSVQNALKLLEKEGLLIPQGMGRNSIICLPESNIKTRPLRVGILGFNQVQGNEDFLTELRHQLEEFGHITTVSPRGIQELGMNVQRVSRHVNKAKADAWVVGAGSREILQWFVDNNLDVFALAGRRNGLPIAGTGPNKPPVYGEVTRKLIELGHERIVFMCLSQIRNPEPSPSVQVFMETLSNAGIKAGEYNLPDWEGNKKGLLQVLDSLFKATPPTAMILDESFLFHAVYHYLAKHKIDVPGEVSLVSTDPDDNFLWCEPAVAHIRWDSTPIVRRILRWVNNISRGIEDRRQNFTPAEFVDGGTIARVRKHELLRPNDR